MGKAENIAKKQAAQAEKEAKARAQKEAQEAAAWQEGSRKGGRREQEAEKREAARLRKEQNAALLAEEERAISAAKPKGKQASGGVDKSRAAAFLLSQLKKTSSASSSVSSVSAAETTTTRPQSPARGAEKVAERRAQLVDTHAKENAPVESFAASSIEDALEMMDSVAKDSSQRVASATVDRHPERRAKAAYIAYEERMLPQLKKENPSLRHTQLKEMLWKMWQKAPENPFNAVHIAHDASRDEEKELVENLRKKTESRLRIE